MNTVNIGILGGGTAAAVNLIAILYNKKVKVNLTCIHDPNIKIQQVGESITPPVVYSMLASLDFNMLTDLAPIDGTIRYGARYFWNEANGQTFDVPYTSPGIHVNSEKFSYLIIDKVAKQYTNIFTQIHEQVVSVEQDKDKVTVNGKYEFDFVIDCMGMPSQLDDSYSTPDFETVNSVILYPDFKKYDEMYTSGHVHKNGWMFGVPLQHRKAWGYLYNRDITPTLEAEQAFATLKGIDTSSLRKISWKHYYKNKALDKRILSSGNKLYFFEPHMTLPLHFYNMLGVDFITKIGQCGEDVGRLNREFNSGYVDGVDRIQDLIALNYAGEINIDSEFWNITKARAKQRLINSDRFQHWLKVGGQYFVHPPKIMTEYVEGYKIDLQSLKRI